MPCRAGATHDVVQQHATIDAENEPSISVSVVAATYVHMRYANNAVKSMCSITATPDDIGRCRV